ncbi:MAG: transglycosylase domain-containing protein [Spirochaetia bacterium]
MDQRKLFSACCTKLGAAGTLSAALWILIALSGIFFGVYAAFRTRLEDPEPTALVYYQDSTYLSEGVLEYDTLGYWEVGARGIERIRTCILQIEDTRFYHHPGVDPRGIVRAAIHNLSGGPIQGGSTIAMQVARLQDSGDRNILNKAIEMLTALFLVNTYGRDAVLRQYMRIAPTGPQFHGFAYAARRFFRKPLEDLSWAEAALLASVPKSPGEMDLFSFDGFQNAQQRAGVILDLLRQEDRITAAEYNAASEQLADMAAPVRQERSMSAFHFTRRLFDQDGLNRGRQTVVRSSLDYTLQHAAALEISEALETFRDFGAGNAAALLADRETGRILAYVGSEDYYDTQFSGAINYAALPRSSGSILKPFIFALGLETGIYTPASIIADLPLQIRNQSGDIIIENYDDRFFGPMLYRRALANSRNTPAVRVLQGIGTVRCYDHLSRLGLCPPTRGPEYYGTGLVLGGVYLTLEDLVRAYGVLANQGRDFALQWRADSQHVPEGRVYTQNTARQISLFLSDPSARLPSFSRLSALEFDYPVAVKTGTSQGYRDAWAIGYSEDYIAGVWIGHPEHSPMNSIAGIHAAGILHRILNRAYSEDNTFSTGPDFPVPENSVPAEICSLSGKLAGRDCPSTVMEYFSSDTVPTEQCNVHLRFAVDSRFGTQADGATPPELVELQVFTVLPPEYAVWAEHNDYGAPPRYFHQDSQAQVEVTSPLDGSAFILDPGLPAEYQSIPLHASVYPVVDEIHWFVNGEFYQASEYPYEIRLPLSPGQHSIQARFPNASVFSQEVTISVSG